MSAGNGLCPEDRISLNKCSSRNKESLFVALVLALYILSYHLQTMLVMPVTTGNHESVLHVGFKSRLVVHIHVLKRKRGRKGLAQTDMIWHNMHALEKVVILSKYWRMTSVCMHIFQAWKQPSFLTLPPLPPHSHSPLRVG